MVEKKGRHSALFETLHSVNNESFKTIQYFGAFISPFLNDCFILTYYSRLFQLFHSLCEIMLYYALLCVVMHYA